MSAWAATKTQNKYGFTIVELLIVVVVIAILAAVSIVAYNGVSSRAKSSALSNLTSQATKKLLTIGIQNSDTYPVDKTAFLLATGLSETAETSYQYSVNNSSSPRTFCVTVTTGDLSYYANSTDQTAPKAGACPGHGVNGVAPVTNLSPNPSARQNASSYEWLSRYSMAPTFITGASDGPIPELTTYLRQTYAAPASGTGRGTDHLDNIDLSVPGTAPERLLYPITAGSPITISVYTRASTTNDTQRISYRTHNGAGAWTDVRRGCAANNYTTPGVWVRLSCTITPTSSGYLTLSTRYEQLTSYPAGATIDTTGLMITNGSTLYDYADGNSQNWVWNGTTNFSTSTGPR